MQKKETKPSMDKNDRRRGRPAGKNRVPLSLAERRARNAQYERERRNETAEAMAQLAEAACCDPQITNPELLATVISQLKRAANRDPSEKIEDLKRINNNLESQIAVLQSRLEEKSYIQENLNIDSYRPTSSRAESDSDSNSNNERPAKYLKTAKDETVHFNAEIARRTSSRQSDLTSDSPDSVWSNHYLGKTLPNQEILRPTAVENTDFDSTSSSCDTKIQKTESVSSEWRQNTSSENESYSENSSQSEAFVEQPASQQDLKVEFQLVHEREFKTELRETHANEQTNGSFTDPFTEREKAILERLGCSDFINYQEIYCEEQSQIWPLDYAGY